jgi:chorismate-pyruvate lyase
MSETGADPTIPFLALLADCTDPRLPAFEQTLAAQDSATAALAEWCRVRGIADAPAIRAEQLADSPPAPPEVRQLLEVSENEPLAYRHVRLWCGDTVFSEADNWYVPARLDPEMNRTLASTEIPFGRVVASLGFRRDRLYARRGPVAGGPEGTVLSHRALLRLPDGRPLSLVTECYTRAILLS